MVIIVIVVGVGVISVCIKCVFVIEICILFIFIYICWWERYFIFDIKEWDMVSEVFMYFILLIWCFY